MSHGKIKMPVEASYAFFSLLACLISFSLVKLNINLGYFFFVMTRALESTDTESENIKTFERLRTKLYLTVLSPLLICFLFVDELAFSFL